LATELRVRGCVDAADGDRAFRSVTPGPFERHLCEAIALNQARGIAILAQDLPPIHREWDP
jgi:hypothetical protein